MGKWERIAPKNKKLVPLIKNEQIYVPVRPIAKHFGGKVTWKNGENPQLTVTYNKQKTQFYIDRQEVYTNGQLVSSTLDSFTYEDYLYLPAKIVADSINQSVYWNTSGIAIGSKEYIDTYKQRSPAKIPVIMYHHFDYNKQTALIMNPDVFYQQMNLLKNEGYTTLTDQDVMAIINGEKQMPLKPIMITLDDGYRSNYDYVYPVLKNLNMKATIFIITDFIEHPENHPSPYPKMTWVQMKEMSDSGLVSFQSHTNNQHNEYQNRGGIVGPIEVNDKLETTQQYKKRVLDDLITSKEILENKLGKPVTTIAYPFGHYSDSSEQLVKQAGFKMAYTTNNGVLDLNEDSLYLIHRVNIHGQSNAQSIMTTLEQVNKQAN